MKAWLAGTMALLLATAGAPAQTTITDATGRAVTIDDPSRIVAIGGVITEILYALGLEDQIAAVDVTSLYPTRALAEKPNVGYMRALSAEGVLAVNPGLIIAVEGSGPPEVLDVLEAASVPFVLVPEAKDADGVVRKIEMVADAAGAHDAGLALARDVKADLDTLATMRAAVPHRRSAVFILSMGAGSPMVAGRNTLPDTMFALAGVDNALSAISGYKAASEEAAMAAAPDAIVLMGERNHDVTAETVFAVPAFKGTPAAQAGRLIPVSGAYFLGLGPRTAQAAHDLAAAVYPELNLPALPARPWTEDTAGP